MKRKKVKVSNKFLVIEKKFRNDNDSMGKMTFLLIPAKGGGIEMISQTGAYYGKFRDLLSVELELHFPLKIKGSGTLKIKLDK